MAAEPRRCVTGHRNARSCALVPMRDQTRSRRTVITEWAWCPDCRSMVTRPLEIQYIGVWQAATEPAPASCTVDLKREAS